jgi:hypothetical protein
MERKFLIMVRLRVMHSDKSKIATAGFLIWMIVFYVIHYYFEIKKYVSLLIELS